MPDSAYFNDVKKWIIASQGYSWLAISSNQAVWYTDEFGVKRNMTTPGAQDMTVFIEAVKLYYKWRLTQLDNYPEVTFSSDYSRFKIHLKEKLYETL